MSPLTPELREIRQDLISIAKQSDVFAETQIFKQSLRAQLLERNPPFITSGELDSIVAWKLDSQYPRSRDLRSLNTDEVVVPITTACLAISSEDPDYSLELKIKILSSLRGVATPLASAVLALLEPDKFAVIDSLLWKFIMKEDKQAFSSSDYRKFLLVIQDLSQYVSLPIQEAEHALWIYISTR